MLHQIQEQQPKSEVKNIIYEFLQKIQPEYPHKLSVEYARTGEAIPLSMAEKVGYPIPM